MTKVFLFLGLAQWVCERGSGGRWKKDGPDMTKCRSLEIKNLKEKVCISCFCIHETKNCDKSVKCYLLLKEFFNAKYYARFLLRERKFAKNFRRSLEIFDTF